MAVTTLDELSVKFTADISGLKTNLDKIEMAVLKVAATTDRAAKKMTSSFNSFGRFLKFDVLARYGAQLIRLEDQMEQLASTIKDTSDRADIGAEALQKLRHVADQNGTSAEAMDSALVRLNKAMGLARLGAEGMREIFAAMGLEELINKGASTEEMFYAIADSVSQFKDESKASAVVAKIMGREADRLIETFKLGGDEAKRVAESLRGVIPQETINKLDEARDRTEEFKKTMNTVGAAASGAFVDTTLWVKDLAEALNEVLGITKMWADLMAWIGTQKFTMDLAGSLGSSGGSLTGVPGVFGGRNVPKGGGSWITKPKSLAAFAASGRTAVKPDEDALGNLLGNSDAANAAKRATEEAERAAAQYRDTISDLTFEIEQLGLAEQEATYQQELRSALSSAGVTLESERGRAIEELVGQLHSAKIASAELAASWEVDAFRVNQALEQLRQEAEEFAQTWERIGQQIEGAFADTFIDIVSGAADAEEAFKRLIAQVLELIAQQLILQAIQGATGEGGIGGALAGIVGGFAAGGTLNPGNAYQLHKNEVVIPKVPMSVIPAGRAGGGSNVISINSTVHAGGASRAEFQTMLSQRDRELVPLIMAAVDDKRRRGLTYLQR